jgi:chromosome segregation ATPase
MDSPIETTSANDFRSPPRILIPKLARSRDQWKAKATARKIQYRKQKIHCRDLEISRERWKERTLDAEQKLQELQQQLQHTEADLAEARSQIAHREGDSKKN